MMKIAFLHYSMGVINRGSEISTQTLANWLAKRGHEVSVYQSGINGAQKYKIKRIKIPFKIRKKENVSFFGKLLNRLYLNGNNFLIFVFTVKTIKYLIKDKPDIIISTNGLCQMLVLKFLKFFVNFKLVVIGRAGIGWHDRHNLKMSPDLFISLSKRAKSWAEKINCRAKIVYLPNAIDLKSFSSIGQLGPIGLIRPIILCVGALSKYKNIDKVIRACSRLDDVSLLVVGRGELKKELEELGKKLMPGRFAIKQFDYSKMPSVYRACDLFCLLSEKREAFGRVFLEAMTSGLVVVTCDYSARKEIVGKAGIYVKDKKPKTVARAIKKGLSENKSELAVEQAEKFSIKKIGPKYEKALLNLVKD